MSAWSIVNCSLSLEKARQLLRLKEREKLLFLSIVLFIKLSSELLSALELVVQTCPLTSPDYVHVSGRPPWAA